MQFHAQERWVFANWLSSRYAEDDSPFERTLAAWYKAYDMDDKASARQEMQRLEPIYAAERAQLTHKQQARYWFAQALLALWEPTSEQAKSASESLNHCLKYVGKSDTVSRIQIAAKLGIAYNWQLRYTDAAHTYSWLVETFDYTGDMTFLIGDWESFRVNVLNQRAHAQFGLGEFDAAVTDLQHALTRINRWIAQRSGDRFAEYLDITTQDYQLPMLLPLDALPIEVKEAPNRSTRIWFELYLWIPWRLAVIVLAQFAIDPRVADEDMWDKQDTLLRIVAQVSESLPSIHKQLPRLNIFAAEFALAICDKIAIDAWPRWLRRAEEALTWADAIHIMRHPSEFEIDLPYLAAITHYQFDFLSAIMRDDLAAITALADTVRALIPATAETGFKHMVGRVHYLLGDILVELDDITQARYEYQTALELYEAAGDGYYPRCEQTRRTLQDL